MTQKLEPIALQKSWKDVAELKKYLEEIIKKQDLTNNTNYQTCLRMIQALDQATVISSNQKERVAAKQELCSVLVVCRKEQQKQKQSKEGQNKLKVEVRKEQIKTSGWMNFFAAAFKAVFSHGKRTGTQRTNHHFLRKVRIRL